MYGATSGWDRPWDTRLGTTIDGAGRWCTARDQRRPRHSQRNPKARPILRPIRNFFLRAAGITGLAREIQALHAAVDALALRIDAIASAPVGSTDSVEALKPELDARFQWQDQAQDQRTAALREPIDGVHRRMDDVHRWLEELNRQGQGQQRRHNELNRRIDDVLMVGRTDGLFTPPGIALFTDNPVALYSNDHQHPRGVANDNTRHPRFVLSAERVMGRGLRVLDIGCAGGGLVLDFLKRGHVAIGLEGSDYAVKQQSGSWPLIPFNLFTCDATQPFTLQEQGGPLRCDLICAWEVLEHIPEERLASLLANIVTHLKPSGLFVASVATFPDFDAETGAVWHVTIQDRAWWTAQFEAHGLEVVESPFVTLDYPRGSGNPGMNGIDWDATANPSLGFHIAARLRPPVSA